jgi:hypothetical protein
MTDLERRFQAHPIEAEPAPMRAAGGLIVAIVLVLTLLAVLAPLIPGVAR